MFIKTSSMLLAAAAALSACLVAADADCSDSSSPGSLAKFRDILSVSKLQAPTSKDRVDYPLCYSSSNFYLETSAEGTGQGDDTFMRFITEDDEVRSELRIPTELNFPGNTEIKERMLGRLRLPATNSEDGGDRYTFMQLHSKDAAPRVRLYTQSSKDGYTDYLWAAFRKGADDGKDKHEPIAPRPDGFFSAEIMLENSQLYIRLDGKMFEVTVSWAGLECYFKAGSYVREGPHRAYFVDISELMYEGSHFS